MLVKQKKKCSGCGACEKSCPVNAISLHLDEDGFSYPLIDTKKCIKCGLCIRICPFNKDYDTKNNLKDPEFFAVKAKDNDIRMKSSSGGVFSVLSNYVLDNKGAVYGVSFDSNFKVKHIKIDKKEEMYRIRGSKYVESELGDIFIKIKKDLLKNTLVLFSGTPCQVAGLKSFLRNKTYDNLITVDLLCHGVSSPMFWQSFVNTLEKKNKSKLKDFYFRHKRKNWHHKSSIAVFKNNKELFNDYFLNSYSELYISAVYHRESCYNCVFTNYRRTGDITLGDFFHFKKFNEKFDDNKGVSMVLLNTGKGKDLFDKVKHNLTYTLSKKNECSNAKFIEPVKINANRKLLWAEFIKNGYEYVAKKYSRYGISKRVRFLIFVRIPGNILEFFRLKQAVKKILKMQ